MGLDFLAPKAVRAKSEPKLTRTAMQNTRPEPKFLGNPGMCFTAASCSTNVWMCAERLACELRFAEVVAEEPMRAVEFARGRSCVARRKVEPWAVMAPQKRLKSLQPSALSQASEHEAFVAHSGVSALITVQLQTIPMQR